MKSSNLSLEGACDELGVSARTVQRWRKQPHRPDGRCGPRTRPRNALSVAERNKVIRIANSPEFRDRSPNEIVPTLADRGEYIASEATFYRVLRAAGQLEHRGASKPREKREVATHVASGPCEVWSWDITYLRSNIRGVFFYLYLFLDVYSRKIVGWDVFDCESEEHSTAVIARCCEAERVCPGTITLHADNGGPMRGSTMLATLQRLGVVPSFSRPSVSNDNPFSESLFRTMKYAPEFPRKPFESLEAAREWVAHFVRWYNAEHRHSGINFVTPDERHRLLDTELLAKRDAVYERARRARPERWSGKTRNWTPIGHVTLNRPRPHRKEHATAESAAA